MTNTSSHRLVWLGKIFTTVARTLVAIGWVVPILALVIHVSILGANKFGYGGDLIIKDLGQAGSLFLAFLIFFPLYFFFGRLGELIDSVKTDDVFTVSNAAHLTAMAWCFLASQLVVLVAIALDFVWVDQMDQEAVWENVIELFLSLPLFLLVVVLFILASVFRYGTAMREDLEGTV